MTILSFDPGATTGIAFYQLDTIQLYLEKTLLGIWRLLQRLEPDTIVFENFALYAHKAKAQVGNEFPSSQVIGIVKLYQELNPQINIYKQPASSAKQLISDKDLQLLECYSTSPHTRDAARHLCYFLITSSEDSPIKVAYRSAHRRDPKSETAA